MKLGTIVFYNTENFFDISDDPDKFENEFTPTGSKKWTKNRYENKVGKISSVLSEIGKKETGELPLVIGLAEVENKNVLTDLVQSEHLAEFGYDFIHFDSLDERGIDTAILYRCEKVIVKKSEPIRSVFFNENRAENQDYTRDVLYTELTLEGKSIHLFVAHLPSRRDSGKNTVFRNQILNEIRVKIDTILEKNIESQIILMGDLNGNPNDKDAQSILKSKGETAIHEKELYNPMLNMLYKKGTLKHKGKWIIFDQILFSKYFLSNSEAKIQFHSAHIYNDRSVQEWDKKYKGMPFRTFVGTKYLGGYSDHFPVYAILNY